MSIKISIPEDEAAQVIIDLFNTMSKLRLYRKRFEDTHAAQVKVQMKFWEGKADDLLNHIQTKYSDHEKDNTAPAAEQDQQHQ